MAPPPRHSARRHDGTQQPNGKRNAQTVLRRFRHRPARSRSAGGACGRAFGHREQAGLLGADRRRCGRQAGRLQGAGAQDRRRRCQARAGCAGRPVQRRRRRQERADLRALQQLRRGGHAYRQPGQILPQGVPGAAEADLARRLWPPRRVPRRRRSPGSTPSIRRRSTGSRAEPAGCAPRGEAACTSPPMPRPSG